MSIRTLPDIWAKRSFRFWIIVGMGLAIIPLGASAILGYFLLRNGVLESFVEIADRQYHQLNTVQQLQLSLWEAAAPIDHFVDEGDPEKVKTYRAMRRQIESQFARLHAALKSQPEERTLMERARTDWSAADQLGAQIISIRRTPGNTQAIKLMEGFSSRIASTNDKLSAIENEIDVAINSDRLNALLAYERTEWISGIAFSVSILLVLLSTWIIGRILSISVDRLVEGASRFGGGDRDHRIDIAIPPELHRVANEFNTMITRINEAELALTELARRDELTGLLNRRAFEEALGEAISRMKRLDEKFALLMFDIDHFKRINDTYGHAVGDRVIKDITRKAKSCLRDIDKVYRIGGEEFAVILLGADATSAEIASERLRTAIQDHPIETESEQIIVTISCGAVLSTPLCSGASLMKEADDALYQAKSAGRNRTIFSWRG